MANCLGMCRVAGSEIVFKVPNSSVNVVVVMGLVNWYVVQRYRFDPRLRGGMGVSREEALRNKHEGEASQQ